MKDVDAGTRRRGDGETGDMRAWVWRSKTARRVARGVGLVGVAGTLFLILVMVFENQFIYFPARWPEGQWQPVSLTFEDVYFESGDGTKLHGWFCPKREARATVLWCHGNAGNLSHRWPLVLRWQQELGVEVFIFDYRGYGRSGGEPSEAGLYDDARAAHEWLVSQKGVDPGRVVLLGRSIGGAVATQLALERPHRALILESTFTSVPEMAREVFGWLPVGRLLRTRFDTAGKIGSYHGPVLITHGAADEVVPIAHGRRLFELANEPKWFYADPGMGHNDMGFESGAEYWGAIRGFVERVLAMRGATVSR